MVFIISIYLYLDYVSFNRMPRHIFYKYKKKTMLTDVSGM